MPIYTIFLLTSPLVTGLCLAQGPPDSRMVQTPEYRVFEDGVTDRAGVRVHYWEGSSSDPWATSPGQISIEYGRPVWKSEYGSLFEKFEVGKRWRLGSNYWTNLSTSFPLQVGDRKLQAGYYYLVLERTRREVWNLIVLEPGQVSKLRLDSWHVNFKDSGDGFPILLEREKLEKAVEKLEFRLKLVEADSKQVVIHIRFGSHHFWSPPLIVVF